MYKHNKKRNVGLISEFFSRYIALAFIENRHEDIKKARALWEKCLGPKTETYKELVLFNALHESSFSSREVAYSLLEKVRDLCKKQSQDKLDQEKAAMINEVKMALKDNEFFDRSVNDFKSFASVQVLMNAWRGIGFKGNLADLAALEESVLEHMLTKKPALTTTLEEQAEHLTTDEVDGLVVKIMTEKLNKKYEGFLTDEQRKMIQLYVYSPKDAVMREELTLLLEDLKTKTLKSIKSPLLTEGLDKPVKSKLQEVVQLLETTYGDVRKNLNDDLVAFYMSVSKLKEEIESEDKVAGK